MLISVHMPKTAGLSFRATLEEHFGDGFSYDYADYPLAHKPLDRHRKVLQAGLEVLMDASSGLPPLIAKTIDAATKRSRELANG